MADRGTGVINPAVPNPSDVALDYSFNWVPQQYGPAYVLSPVGVVGGPGAVYVDVAAGLDPAPPAPLPPVGDGAGVMVVMALPGGRTVQVPV